MSKILYKDATGYKYQLLADWSVQTPIKGAAARLPGFVELDQAGMLTVHAGYSWDGASGPTIDTKSSMRASLAHDALYQLEREGHLGQEWRKAADEMLYKLCVDDGMWRWRARCWLWAVRRFAAGSAKPQAPVTLEAP